MAKPTLKSQLSENNVDFQNVLDSIKGMTPEDAVVKINELSGGKLSPSPVTVVRMVEREKLTDWLTIVEKRRGRPPVNPDVKPKEKKTKKVKVEEPPKETHDVSFTCSKCGVSRNEKVDNYSCFGTKMNLALVGRRCRGCGQWGTLIAKGKAFGKFFSKAIVNDEVFIDDNGKTIQNPLENPNE